MSVLAYSHWQELDLATDYWPYTHFTPEEMADRHSGALVYDTDFMSWLVGLRIECGYPFILNSAYRTSAHQLELTGRATGAHVDAQAVDVRIYGARALDLVQKATQRGALGIGVNQLGPISQRYIHIDRWTKAPEGKRPALWNY